MERRDKWLLFCAAVLSIAVRVGFHWDFFRLAEQGMTLSSIVLAVYVAAIIGLINTNLSKQMRTKTIKGKEDTSQLGLLVLYFKVAIFFSVPTIIVSSICLLINIPEDSGQFVLGIIWVISTLGMISFAENLVMLGAIIRFMLNRQIWET